MSQGLLQCKFLDNLQPNAKKIIFWKQPIESAIFMLVGLTILFSLACLSFISVVGYACLTMLCCSAGYKIYFEVAKHFKLASADDSGKSPFQSLMNMDLSFSEDSVQSHVKSFVHHASAKLQCVRSAILVENYFESAKFALMMYMLTVVGSMFNLLTIVTLGFVITMTWPKLYDLYQPQIDQVVKTGLDKVSPIWSTVKDKLNSLPIPGKKKEE